MSSAFRANIQITATVEFEEFVDLNEGSFYLGALGVESVVLSEASRGRDRKSKRAVAPGAFWEEQLEYNFEPGQDGAVEISVSGRFAFEFIDPADLENYVIDDEPVDTIVIGWAKDGNSPKLYAKTVSCSGSLFDVEDDEDFSEL